MSDDLETLVARLRSGSTYDDRTDAADLIEAQAAEITRLRAELATARREGMEEAAKRLEELHKNHNYDPESGTLTRKLGRYDRWPESAKTAKLEHDSGYYRAIAEGVAHIRAAAGEEKPGKYSTEAEQERDEFFNRLGRVTEYLGLPVDATAQRIIETIRERVENEREECASVEVRVIVPDGAETWTPLEAWEEAIIAFDEAFRGAIRAAAGEVK